MGQATPEGKMRLIVNARPLRFGWRFDTIFKLTT
jgi:hypothetical protein